MNERDALIQAAVREGRFPPERVPHYQQMYEADAIGTTQLILMLAPDPRVALGPQPGTAEHAAAVGRAAAPVQAASDPIPPSEEAYPKEWLRLNEQHGPVTFEDDEARRAALGRS